MLISDMVRLSGVSKSTIRLYEKRGWLEEAGIIVTRLGNRYREYTMEDPDTSPVNRLLELYNSKKKERIQRLKVRNFTRELRFKLALIPGLSVNHCYVKTKTGARVLTKGASVWKEISRITIALAAKDAGIQLEQGEIDITVDAYFKDERGVSDLDNLKKLLADAIKSAIGVDDKFFFFHDGEKAFDPNSPHLAIKLEMRGKNATKEEIL
jgi:hypothetical protein